MGHIRPIAPSDASAFARIYNHYIRDTVVSFEEDEIDEKEALQRIQKITSKHPWLVFESNAGSIN